MENTNYDNIFINKVFFLSLSLFLFYFHLRLVLCNEPFNPRPIGITTQTILTIPVSQQINSNEQLVQTLAALNNSAASLNHQLQQQQQPSPLLSLPPNQMPNVQSGKLDKLKY